MSSSEKRSLRILYTLNGSPQYILARSHSAVPVVFVPSQANGVASSSRIAVPPPLRYATASLKTCLDTICRSSPEIIQDPTRDFSVYLLDPLETDCAPAQVNLSHSRSSPPVPDAEARVAVGLGLMSWGLLADESDAVAVTGTLKVSGAGQEMLEIIFSLRETIPMHQGSLPGALRSWGLPSNGNTASSSRSSSSALKSKKKQAEIAAKRKPKWKPLKTPRVSSVPVTESDKLLVNAYVGPEKRAPGRPPWKHLGNESSGSDDVVIVDGPSKAPCDTRQGNDKPEQGSSSILDLLAYFNAMTPEIERNKALGAVLGLMHGTNGTAVYPPPELANAMTVFSDFQRTAGSSSHLPPSEPSSQPNSQHRRKSSSTDDEIVVLNKENVNPTAFRRRTERDKLGSADQSEAPTMLSADLPSRITTRLLEASKSLGLIADKPPLTRKRTLTEFMEEHESIREGEKAERKKNYYRKPDPPLSEHSAKHYKGNAPTFIDPNNSSRPRTASTASSPGPSVRAAAAPIVRAPPSTRATASSPVRPSTQVRKNYVVPAWARTDTATQPRLSDRVIQRQKKEEDKKMKERKLVRNQKDREKKGNEANAPKDGTPAQATGSRNPLPAPSKESKAKAPSLPAPVAASGEFFVFAKSPSSASTRSRPPSPSPPHLPPSTPPRKRAHTISTPGESSSLFTPASCSWDHSEQVLGSGRRSMSPLARKAPTQDSRQPSPVHGAESDDEDDLLGRELDNVFSELDFPSSSLPVASGDIEVDPGTETAPTSNQDYDSEDDSDDPDCPPKQHWVGLPPSSPPPPSSPFASGDSPMDDDVEELFLTTPDTDPGSEFETLDSPGTDISPYSAEELNELLNIDDLANFFPAPAENFDAASLFDQFTHHNVGSDDNFQTMDGFSPAVDPDFDFTEFWESVKPLIEASSQPTDTNLGFQPSDAGDNFDHTKLAGDVHALFSGCLV